MVDHKRILSLKYRAFQRDGWSSGYDATHHRQIWLAVCAFPDCDTIIDWETATLDHHPIPHHAGGQWSLSNLRLACKPCNSTFHSQVTGPVSQLMPPGLTRPQKKLWWQEYYLAQAAEGNLCLPSF